MPWLAAMVGGAILNIAGSLVLRVLTALAIGVVSYTGLNASINWLKSGAIDAIMSLPPGAIAVLSLLKVGTCISMVFSAMVIRFTLQGMQSDTVKSWVKK